MALCHFHVGHIGRAGGQSAIASAAYRAGEELYSEYYGETNDFTRKGGVTYTEIMLPPNAPPEYKDRQTLWNAVELHLQCRSHHGLAYAGNADLVAGMLVQTEQ